MFIVFFILCTIYRYIFTIQKQWDRISVCIIYTSFFNTVQRHFAANDTAARNQEINKKLSITGVLMTLSSNLVVVILFYFNDTNVITVSGTVLPH